MVKIIFSAQLNTIASKMLTRYFERDINVCVNWQKENNCPYAIRVSRMVSEKCNDEKNKKMCVLYLSRRYN